ncbi:MAG: 2-deoxy-5-keto-D-gluconate 6-phosphate aldolase domain-containing protein [Solirubrobacteraceae bacterium]
MTTFILAVDHRNSLRGWLASLGVRATDTTATARRLKALCVDALAQARPQLQAEETPMLLLDEEYGVDAIPAARAQDLPIVIPVERSGQAEFIFEHGDDFGQAIDRTNPDAVKALVRYNPAGDAALNARSRAQLQRLQDALRHTSRRFMLELLVPPTAEQQATAGDRFDDDLRPQLTTEAISQLARDGLRPDWWKLEGNNSPQAASIVATAAADTSQLGALVLGRGQHRDSVLRWVQIAAATGTFVGFAVGRTLWTDPFAALLSGHADERETVNRIAGAYLDVASAYRSATPAQAGSDRDR